MLRSIYTYGDQPAKRSLTVADLVAGRGNQRWTQTYPATAEDAALCEEAGIDILAVWDHQVHDFRRMAPHAFMIACMAPSAYTTNDAIMGAAIDAAAAGADAVYTARSFDVVEMLAKEGLAVQGHIGLIPSFSTHFGGLRTIGRTAEEAMAIVNRCRQYESAGAFSVEAECVAVQAMQAIRKETALVTHSIGSGPHADVIYLYMEDLCGEHSERPRHAKAFGNVNALKSAMQAEKLQALNAFRSEVRSETFPDGNHTVEMNDGEYAKLNEQLSISRTQ